MRPGRSAAARARGGDCPARLSGGEEQLANAAGCLALIDALSGLLPVAEDALVRGLRSARLNGRSERREIGGVTWVFDVAHNPAAAAALARTLAGDPVAGRTRCVVAIMGDKDHRGVLAPMLPVVDEWLLTRSAEARGAPPALLAEALGEQAPATVCFDIREACVPGPGRWRSPATAWWCSVRFTWWVPLWRRLGYTPLRRKRANFPPSGPEFEGTAHRRSSPRGAGSVAHPLGAGRARADRRGGG